MSNRRQTLWLVIVATIAALSELWIRLTTGG